MSKVSNACRTGVLAYHYNMMDYLFNVNNYVAWAILNNQLPYEEFWGGTPDISMIWFKFWEPMYFWNWADKASKVFMNPGRSMGFEWNIGDPVTFKVLQCNKDPHKRNIVVHRGVVIPQSLT